MDKQKVLNEAKGFYKEMNLLKDYPSRMRLAEKYYKGWYRDVAQLDLGKESGVSNPLLPTFFPGKTQNKSVYLFSPSISEIKLFSSKFKKVYFSAVPKLQGVFPTNSEQIHYNKDFELPGDKIKGLKVDFAFSHHVVEHIHPDDIKRHLEQVYSLLKQGGAYLFVCPSSIRIKKDEKASNFFSKVSVYHHIGRYSYASILNLSKEIGFSKSSRPLINPNIINFFYEYRADPLYDYLKKSAFHIPDPLLSILGISSLYILITK